MRSLTLAACASLVFLVSSAHAEVLTHTTTISSVQPGGTAAVALPRFDSSLGVLDQVTLSIRANMNCTFAFENTSNVAMEVGGWSGTLWLAVHVPWQAGGLSGVPASSAYGAPTTFVSAYDGATDYGGSSGATFTVVDGGASGAPDQAVHFLSPSQFGQFVGAGTVPFSIGPMFWNMPTAGGHPPGIVTQGSGVSADLILRAQYYYRTNPTTICPGQIQAAFCPCNNYGTSPAGCGNSLQSSGGLLSPSGTPSIANDTLTLLGSGMTNSNALYFQGTNFNYAQSVYGDGLRCVTGSVVRLGTRTNSAGASQVPSVGGTPISTVGSVTTPGTRYYQVIYRDNGSFCTSSNFNATSGLSIAWSL